jgi:hypothetical protein
LQQFFVFLQQKWGLHILSYNPSFELKVHLCININNFVGINVNCMEDLLFHCQHIKMSQCL